MSSLFFWREWDRVSRFIYVSSLFVVGCSLLALVVAWAGGLSNVVRWDVLSELSDVPVSLHQFTDGLLDYSVGGKAYVVSEQFIASAMQLRPGVATALLTGVGLAFVLILSTLTQFDRLRYLVGLGVLILGLAFFRWEMLEVPGLEGNTLFLILTCLYGGLSYYFHAFRPDWSLPVRLIAFGGLTALVALGLGVSIPVQQPALALVSYGMPVLLAISTGFIFFIAAEIVAGLVWLTSVSRGPQAVSNRPDGQAVGTTLGMRNFLIITGLYLVNLALVWLRNTKLIEWDVLAISPFGLYLISVVVGIWGFRRLVEQQAVVAFRPTGAVLYLGLTLLTTLTIAYAFATANDPLVELFEDVIVYTHLAMGLVFVAYVLINFWPIFHQHLAVYRVLYKPRRLELSLFRVVGVVLMVVLVASGGLITFRQGVAGYYNGLGDYYVATGQATSGSAFYQLALEQEFQNHKSNYALASLALAQDDQATAAFYFQRAMLKQPHPQDYVGLSQSYLQTNLFFEAVKALQQGIRAFPGNGELQNNLGFLYARTSVADSAYIYLKAAAANAGRSEVAEANLLAFYARHPLVLSADSSLVQSIGASDYDSYQANALAVRLLLQADTTQPARPGWLATAPAGEGLSVGRFASLYNFALASHQPDTALATAFRQREGNPLNQDFSDDLLLARAVAEYKARQPATAFALLDQLAEGDSRNGAAYRSVAGLWLLEQGFYQRAADTFGQNRDTTSIYYRAVALTKAGDLPLAQSYWETAATTDSAVAGLKRVLYNERPPQTDIEKAIYVAWRPDDASRGRYWETIADPSLKTVAGVALTNDYLDGLQWRNAQLMLSGMPRVGVSPVAVSLRNVAAVRLSAFRRSVGSARTMAVDSILPQHRAEADYWLGQAYDRTRQPALAQPLYARALALAPLNGRYVTAMAELLRARRQTRQAYDLVLTALPYNENRPELLKTYISLCLEQGLPDYATEALARLQGATSPADYQAFLATYQQKLASIEKSKQKFLE